MKTTSFWSNPYAWLWFHLEAPFIRDFAARRPFTFILRDFYHCHEITAILLLLLAGYTLGRWILRPLEMAMVITGLLLGHLFWGNPWQKGEQEQPPYPPGGGGTTD